MDQDCQTPDVHSEITSFQPETKISKNQLKKQRKREKWLAIKQDRRRHSKENRKRRLAEMREKGEATGPTRKSLKSNTMKNSSCKIRVVLDLSFDEYMAEKDVNSLTSQLQHSYSANRRAENPLQLYLCSLGGKTKQRLDEIGDYKGWDLHKETKDYEQLFPKESLIYLSSESPNILTALSEDKVYLIGGLVDHNKHKGLCHKIAEEKGIAHAQLPIAEYLEMKSRKVLAVNHVFSILLRYTETNDWRAAFLAEMPQRKQAQLREENAHVDSTSHTNSAPNAISNDLHNNPVAEECSNNLCINKSDELGVNEDQDPKSNSFTNGRSTVKQEFVVCSGETAVGNRENSECESSTKKELYSKISLSEVDKEQNIEQNSDKDVEEKTKKQSEVDSV